MNITITISEASPELLADLHMAASHGEGVTIRTAGVTETVEVDQVVAS